VRNYPRIASALFFVLAIALGSAGAFTYLGSARASGSGTGLVLEGDPLSFGDVIVGEEAVVTARLRNTTTRPVRLLGSDRVCQKNACLEVMNLPPTVPAGSIGEVTIRVTTRGVGDFSGSFDVFTDLAGRTKFPIEVRGHIHEARPAS